MQHRDLGRVRMLMQQVRWHVRTTTQAFALQLPTVQELAAWYTS
jgi:hypothetical protein